MITNKYSDVFALQRTSAPNHRKDYGAKPLACWVQAARSKTSKFYSASIASAGWGTALVAPYLGKAASVLNSHWFKRATDAAVAGIALLLLLPVFVLVGLAIRYSNGLRHPAPVFFGHTRIGRNGKRFKCLKFRTMKVDGDSILRDHLAANPAAAEEWRLRQKLDNDPRVDPFGAFLRKTSIDELPQFINVLRGDMSCVGPRPITEAEACRYGDYLADYMRVRPGISGLWQVSGRNRISYERRVALDRYYARRRTYWLDLRILILTFPAILRSTDTS